MNEINMEIQRLMEQVCAVRSLLDAAITVVSSTVRQQEMLIGIKILADQAAETAEKVMWKEMNPTVPAFAEGDEGIRTEQITGGQLTAHVTHINEPAESQKPYQVGSAEAQRVINKVKEENREQRKAGRPRKETK